MFAEMKPATFFDLEARLLKRLEIKKTQLDVLRPLPVAAVNGLLGVDTTNAFAAACWPPELFGNSFSSPPACVVPPTSSTPAGTPTPVN